MMGSSESEGGFATAALNPSVFALQNSITAGSEYGSDLINGKEAFELLSSFYHDWGSKKGANYLTRINHLCSRSDAPDFWKLYGVKMIKSRINQPIARALILPDPDSTAGDIKPPARPRFSYGVVETLKAHFRKKSFFSKQERQMIAMELGLLESQVTNWYCCLLNVS